MANWVDTSCKRDAKSWDCSCCTTMSPTNNSTICMLHHHNYCVARTFSTFQRFMSFISQRLCDLQNDCLNWQTHGALCGVTVLGWCGMIDMLLTRVNCVVANWLELVCKILHTYIHGLFAATLLYNFDSIPVTVISCIGGSSLKFCVRIKSQRFISIYIGSMWGGEYQKTKESL